MGNTGEYRWCLPTNSISVGPIDLEKVVEMYRLHWADHHSLRYWVTHEPENAAAFAELRTVWPNAVCLHAYRHPLDNLCSINERTIWGKRNRPGGYWCHSNERNCQRILWVWERVRQQQAAGVPIRNVCLEDFATEIPALYDALGLQHHPQMLEPWDMRLVHANRWHYELKGEQLTEALELLGPLCEDLGYGLVASTIGRYHAHAINEAGS